MRYVYTCWTYPTDGVSDTLRGDTFTRAEQITDAMVTAPRFVDVWDSLKKAHATYLNSVDDRDEWIEILMRNETWKSDVRPCVDTVRAELHELDADRSAMAPLSSMSYEGSELKITSLIGVAKPDAINPPHYQGFLILENETLQWLETMQYLSRYKDQNVFKGAIELQARKYLDRLGGKDEESQEIMKAVWYLKFLAAYIKNGGPIRVADIDTILARK
jgi:hypothetical protein